MNFKWCQAKVGVTNHLGNEHLLLHIIASIIVYLQFEVQFLQFKFILDIDVHDWTICKAFF